MFGLHGAARARTLAPEQAEATERGATAGAAGGAPSEAAREAAQAHSAAPIPMAASATRWARTETRNDPHDRPKGQQCGGVSTGGVLGKTERGIPAAAAIKALWPFMFEELGEEIF